MTNNRPRNRHNKFNPLKSKKKSSVVVAKEIFKALFGKSQGKIKKVESGIHADIG